MSGGATHFDPASLRLIAITDSLRDGIDGLAARAAMAVAGGATMLHLRLPNESPRTVAEAGRALRAAAPQVPLLVSERADVALAAGAQGVHSGLEALSPSTLRRFVPNGFIVGVSVAEDDAMDRVTGSDYVAIGPVFGSGGSDAPVALGAERFGALARRCGLPAVAVGGVTAANIAEIMAAGAAGVAVISAVLGSSDPATAARLLRAAARPPERQHRERGG